MKILISHDISEKLSRILDRRCDPSVTRQLQEINRSLENIMSKIELLRTAVNGLELTSANGFALMADGFQELAADIAAMPLKADADIEAEAIRVSGVATQLGEFSATFAQRLKDAIPTAPDTEPLPAPATEPIPVSAPEDNPNA